MKNQADKERKFWNSFAGKYDKFISKALGSTYENLYKNLIGDVQNTDNVLEIGTGTGLIAFRICEYAKSITALDYSPEMIQIAKKKQTGKQNTTIHFETGDCYNLNFNEKTFDLVIASNIMHLLTEPEKALSEIKRVMKLNGRVILPTFCHGDTTISRFLSGIFGLFGFRAYNKWSTGNFKKFIENNGFKIIRSEAIRSKIPLMYIIAEKHPV